MIDQGEITEGNDSTTSLIGRIKSGNGFYLVYAPLFLYPISSLLLGVLLGEELSLLLTGILPLFSSFAMVVRKEIPWVDQTGLRGNPSYLISIPFFILSFFLEIFFLYRSLHVIFSI